MQASIDSIETFGLVDGPGIRTVVFFNGCMLRCKFCHNPEMWNMKKLNYTSDELVEKILRNEPYFRKKGGVTFSGGEPLLQIDFLIETCKKLKEKNIHIALDTAGVGIGRYNEILDLVDLVILDIKHVTRNGYLDIAGRKIDESIKFINELNKSNKEVWLRQVVVPNITDTKIYMNQLKQFVKQIKNVSKIEFLPYHTMGIEKYHNLNIPYLYENIEPMDKIKCDELYNEFIKDL